MGAPPFSFSSSSSSSSSLAAAPPPPPPPPPPRCWVQAYQLLGHVDEARQDLVTAATVEVGEYAHKHMHTPY